MIAHMTIKKKKIVYVMNKYYVRLNLPAELISHQESLSYLTFGTSLSKSGSYQDIQ